MWPFARPPRHIRLSYGSGPSAHQTFPIRIPVAMRDSYRRTSTPFHMHPPRARLIVRENRQPSSRAPRSRARRIARPLRIGADDHGARRIPRRQDCRSSPRESRGSDGISCFLLFSVFSQNGTTFEKNLTRHACCACCATTTLQATATTRNRSQEGNAVTLATSVS